MKECDCMPASGDRYRDEPKEYEVEKNEDDIQTLREKRVQMEGYQYISKLRKDAAKYRARAEKLGSRARTTEAKVAKLDHKAVMLRRKAKQELENVHELERQINELNVVRKGSDPIESEKLRVRVAKLEAKKAKHQSKASSLKAKAAAYTERGDRSKMKIAQLKEESKKNEVEARDLEKRADKMESMGE